MKDDRLTTDILAQYFDDYKLKFPVEYREFNFSFIKVKNLMKVDLENVNLFTVMPYDDGASSMIHFPVLVPRKQYYVQVKYYTALVNTGLQNYHFYMENEPIYLPKKEYELLQSVNIYKFLNQAFRLKLTLDEQWLQMKP